VAEALAAHLASLPAPQFARVAAAVLGTSVPASRDAAVQAVARQLLDPDWVTRTLERLGSGARAALATVARAGVPVLRRDVSALVASHDDDPVDALEEHGLLAPVRTGRGMPTHIAIPPGLEDLLRAHPAAGAESSEQGAQFTGTRRRFDLALTLAIVAQDSPRLLRAGRLHAADLSRLAHHLAPLGLRPAAVEARLLRWLDLGIAREVDGRIRPIAAAFDDVPRLFVVLALAELAAPSTPEGTLHIIARLLASAGTLPLREAIEAAQSALLRDRAGMDGSPMRGARSEIVEVARSLLSLDALVLQDGHGRPLAADDERLLRTNGESPYLAIEPHVGAALRGEPAPEDTFSHGHVQSSYEVVADSGCDPSLVARIAVWSRLVRADRAAVLALERETVVRARKLGFQGKRLFADLVALSGMPVPGNVATVLRDWIGSASVENGSALAAGSLPELLELRSAALGAMLTG
jgi:hypothetical protein